MFEARNFRILRTATFFIAVCFSALTVHAQYGGGTGEPNDPYLIYTAEQMNTIGAELNDLDKHFRLMADIDLGSYSGTSFNIIGPNQIDAFRGSFDGQGHKITNFTWGGTRQNYVGLFGCVKGAEVKDLGLESVNINAPDCDYVGGLMGYNNWFCTISNCYVTGNITGKDKVGVLVGYNMATILNSYSQGSVSGNDCVGGLVGDNTGGAIITCFSSSIVSGNSKVGGLLGAGGGVTNSFWDIDISGRLTSAGGSGKTTAQMKTADTYLGWTSCDNESAWILDEGNDYPRLGWENKSGQPMPQLKLSDFLEGTGTQDDPYLISSAPQLNLIGLFTCEWDKHYKLINDIDMADYTDTEFNIIGTNWIYTFTGVIDGQEYRIFNFSWLGMDQRYIGLIGYLDGEIKNLGMEAVEVNAPGCDSVGGLVAINRGVISNCYVAGNILGNRQVGGLAGFNDTQQDDSDTGIIQNCYTTGSVSGNSSVGGLLGDNYDECAVSNCYSLSEVRGSFGVGGLVGVNENKSNISGSYASGNVSGNINVGGLAGSNENNSNISDSYATGSVSGDYKIGGLVGENTDDSIISNCYASGLVTGNENYIGGLVGENYNSAIHDSYSKGSVYGNNEVGGLVGRMRESESSISGSYATGNVSGNELAGGLAGYSTGFIRDSYATGEILGTVYVGGLVGSNGFEGTIYCCCASGVVSGNEYVGALVGRNGDGIIHCSSATGSVSGDSNIGGLVGYNYGTIYRCYAGGKMLDTHGIGGLGIIGSIVSTVTGDEKVGGLVGFNCGYISYCYSICKVTGNTNVGGFMGENQSGEVTNSLWDFQSSGHNSMCGIQDGYGCHDSFGKTTAQMQTAATFLEEGWDFTDETENGTEDIWKITDGLDYPHLWWEKYGGGTGEPNDPYLIYTAEQLNTIGLNQEDADKHFKLMADIDLSAYQGDCFNRIGYYPTDFDPNRHYSFTGVFDGNNHTISNFTYVADVNEPPSWGYYGDTDVGLFGVLSGEIKNLGLIDPNIYPAATCSERVSRVGAIAGRLSRGSITNCYVEGGQVSSDLSVGGLVGEVSRGGTISNCYTTCDVTLAKERWLRPIEEPWGQTGSSFGGLVGSTRGQIYNCCATGRIQADSIVGGLVGYIGYDEYSDAVIYDSYATGDVSGEESVGGLVGRNDDTIRRCCALGSVSGFDMVGGLVGFNTRWGNDQYVGIVTNSYAINSVSGNNHVGGMAGVNTGMIIESYSAAEVTGINNVGGLVGTNRYLSKDGTADNCFWDKQTSGQQTSAGGTGLNTEQMQTTNTFLEAGWDFVHETENGTEDIWWIDEGYDYPHLWWEN